MVVHTIGEQMNSKLYRHNYYAKDPSVDPKKEPLNVEIAKNRHGKIGTVQLTFDLTTGRFVV